MSKPSEPPPIRLRGVRQNNLKNFDLDLPQHRLIVVTGLSGSGKSSLAFDTLFAEGQRRYVETFSPYARQFFDRMDKPAVDSIENIPPAIAIEQRNAVRTTRSTVGTMTEVCDHLKVLWPHLAQLHCRRCGAVVRKDTPQQVWQSHANAECGVRNAECLVTFDLALSEKLGFDESLALIAKQGFQRLLLGGEIVRVEEAASHSALRTPHSALTVIQDRLRLAPGNRSRFIEACEQAYHFGKGKLAIHELENSKLKTQDSKLFSARLHCAACDLEYREPSPALFSFNHPLGACPACRGFGRIISIDHNLVLPDRSKTLAQGVVRPWLTGTGAESQDDLMKFCRKRRVPTDVPFARLPEEIQRWVIDGDPGYGTDAQHQWPRAWYGVKGYFRWLESKSYKMHVRVLLSRYRAYTKCPACEGKRFQPDSLLWRFNGLTLADIYTLPIRDALSFIEQVANAKTLKANDPLGIVLGEIRARLGYLAEVGLGYLTLDRPTRTLSGGETERVNLTTCLGTRLVNTLFVLDEPSVGLHPRDTDRLIRILERLRDAGNTVVVVEHEASVIRAADHLVDLGPGHGESGGQVVFQGSPTGILRAKASLTGAYLSGRKRTEPPSRRAVSLDADHTLTVENAAAHNLKNLTVEFPLGRFVCVTGVSGSGKTTLMREVLLPALKAHLQSSPGAPKASDRLDAEAGESDGSATAAPQTGVCGAEQIGRVLLVDQSILGKTPRSNPAVYIGAFDDIREFFAQTEAARRRGLNASAFSFNSTQGQCERCRGAGYEKIEMQFLSDVFIRCPECSGRRYRKHIIEVKVSSSSEVFARKRNLKPETRNSKHSLSIADLLDATVDEAIAFLGAFSESRPAQRAAASLNLLQEVGLGYLRLGQPINTLSGGESQRLKLVSHLAEFGVPASAGPKEAHAGPPEGRSPGKSLFLFDEPTTGLHFDDVRVLLRVFQRLVDAGHSLIVIEHNLDVIACADWVIDLGPDAGDEGGRLVAAGPPELIMDCVESHTGSALREHLGRIETPPLEPVFQ